MNTKEIDIVEAQEHFREVLALVENGLEVILTEGNTPLARLIPLAQPAPRRKADLHRGALIASDDFDEPLPDGFWLNEK